MHAFKANAHKKIKYYTFFHYVSSWAKTPPSGLPDS